MVKNNSNYIVANIHTSFFVKGETFIFNYISNLKQFRPICLALEYVNLDLFPFPKEDMYYFNRNIFGWVNVRRLKRISKAQKIIKSLGVKLLHAHFGPEGYYSLNLKRACGLPLVTTFYGYDVSRLARKNRWRRKYKKLFSEGDLFLVEGNYMKSRLTELGCPEEKVQVQRIAIAIDKMSYVPRKPKKPDEKVILLFSGRFVEKKGLIYALQAIERIRNEFSNFEFRIIGDGPLKIEIEKFVKDHGLNTRVKLLGFLTYEKHLNEMSKADIFISPSITASDGDDEGGAPTTLLEAQAMGVPVISTYLADIPNIVIPDKSALLSKEKDTDSLARNILSLLKNQAKWESMGRVGRKFVETYHDVKKETDKLEHKYKSLLNKGP